MTTSRSDIERVRDFNRELLSLQAAGIDFDLDLGRTHGKRARAAVERVDQVLAEATGQGRSLEQIFAGRGDIPSRYRAAVFTYLRTDDAALALESLSTSARARRELGRSIGRMLFYPLLIVVLTYFAFMLLILLAGPTIEALSRDYVGDVRGRIDWLVWGREWMHWWASIVPIVVLGLILWWWLASGRSRWGWLPGARQYYRIMQNAYLAERLAMLIQHGYTVDQALSMSGPVDADPSREDLKTHSLPALLRWVLTSPTPDPPHPHLLRFVAETYRQSAIRKQYVWRTVVPGLVGVLIGGVFVLAYGIGLFGPLYEMLNQLASPRGLY